MKQAMKRALALLICLCCLLSLLPPAAVLAEPARFDDVGADAWYAPAVEYAVGSGLFNGVSETRFAPDSPMTRAMTATVLYRLTGAQAGGENPFADVPENTWYTDAVIWASGAGVIQGTGSGFSPDSNVTREQLAAMLFRCARVRRLDVSGRSVLAFPDSDLIAGWAEEAMSWAVSVGLFQGNADGSLNPRGNATRAEVAALMQRFAALESPLSLWTGGAGAAQALYDYVSAVTDVTGADYIPVRDRIAVFDLDGTLFCETDPNYFDYTLLKYRVLEDPDYKNKASDFEREVANKIKEQNETGKSFSGLEVDHGRAVASAFAGMTVAEFNAYIQKFKEQPMPSYTGMNRGGGFYQPMVQVVNYLQANDFTVYIVSGTDRLIVRGIIDNSVLDIPNRQIIGSDETIVSSNQAGKDGLDYVFAEGDELVLGGDFLIKNLKMNKVSVIMQEIGQQPVLSFGNSTGDSSMAEYVTSGNEYKSLAFMLCCDDTERENGSQSKADKMYALCEEFDWIPVSMKNDWTTIYGDGVTYTGKQ